MTYGNRVAGKILNLEFVELVIFYGFYHGKSPKIGEMIQFDEYFSKGWLFNHHGLSKFKGFFSTSWFQMFFLFLLDAKPPLGMEKQLLVGGPLPVPVPPPNGREKGHVWSQVQFAALLLLGAGETFESKSFEFLVVGWQNTLGVCCFVPKESMMILVPMGLIGLLSVD